jgi:cytoskeletal protein CcmA (bactofilin family)
MTLPLKPRAVTASGIVVRRHESITPYGKAHVYGVLFGDLDRAARDAIDMHCAQHAVPLEGQRYRPGVVSFARRYVLNRSRERGAIPARVVVSDGGHMRDLGVVLVEATGRRDVRLTVESPIVETSIVELHTAGSPTALTGRVGSVQALETSLGTRFLADVTTQTMGARKMHASLRLYEAIRRHVAAYQQIVYAKVSHGATATAAALQDLRVLYRSPSDTGDVMNIRSTAAPPDTRAALTPALNGPPTPSAPTLLAVYGGSAKLEGKFDVQESIEIQCEITGELHVGGTLIIGERGRVTADVSTANAVINGSYSGNLKATGAVEIAATGRVGGKIESAELVIAKGAIFTGTVTHIDRSTQDSVALAPSAQERLPDAERPIPVSKLVELNVSGVHQAQPTSRATLGGVS